MLGIASEKAMIAMGVLTNRHQRHDKYWVSSPPVMSPIAAPTPDSAPYTPKAFARSLESVNVTEMSESDAGARSAPKTPCNARAPKSICWFWAKPPSSEAPAKPTSPIRNAFLRPR